MTCIGDCHPIIFNGLWILEPEKEKDNMAQLYKVDRHVLEHLDNNKFRIDTRVSTKEIKKDYFNMIDSNLSLFLLQQRHKSKLSQNCFKFYSERL